MSKYETSRELFQLAIQSLANEGSFRSRLSRSLSIISVINPESELPSHTYDEFQALRSLSHINNTDDSDDVSSLYDNSLNTMQISCVINSFVHIYRCLESMEVSVK
ncbi:hypothetical protein EKG38_07445 [Shewanella canadensis]|uniref:Uncharacterized protein n=1 Tax=Shewanella canadensis TaxID=271096 RepID=A0A3S0KVT3_9GAMM|nr:hypothetical protein [Shewanella canadensis]RTR39628.1 hypothetical protein EKG38_07445 [Shewanella canadensis]